MGVNILHDEIYNAFLHITHNYVEILQSMSKSDNKMVANLIGDLIMHSVKEKNIAMIAANAGVLSELSHIAKMDKYEQNKQFSKAHKKLVNNFGLEANACELVLSIFVYALGVKDVRSISEVDEYLSELDKLPVEEMKCITCISSQIPGLYITGQTGDGVLEECIRGTRLYNLRWAPPVRKRVDEETLELSLFNRINDIGIIVKITVKHVGDGKGRVTAQVYKQNRSGTGFVDVGNAKEIKILLEEIAKNQGDNDIRKMYIGFLKKRKQREIDKQAEEIDELIKLFEKKNREYMHKELGVMCAEEKITPQVIWKEPPTINELFLLAAEADLDWYLIEVNEPIGVYKEKYRIYETLFKGVFVRIKVIEKVDKYGGMKSRYVSFLNPMYGFREEESSSYGEFPKLSSLLKKKAVDIKEIRETKDSMPGRRITRKEIITAAYSPSDLFRANDCYIVDKRSADGCLWVMGDFQVLKKCSEIVEKRWGIKGHFGAGKVSNNKQAWFTKDDRYDEVEELGAKIRMKKKQEALENAMEVMTFTQKDILDSEKMKYYPVADLFSAFWKNKECFNRICNKHDVKPEVIELLNDVASKETNYLKAKIIVAVKTKTHLSEYDLMEAVNKRLVSTTEREKETSFWWERTILVTAMYNGVVVGEYKRTEKRE